MVCGAETCSYAQLYESVAERAASFVSQRGHMVLFRASQTIDYLVTYMAIHLAGAVAAPIECDTPQPRFDKMAHNLSTLTVPQGIADVLHTTGTTGQQKGVMVSHRAIIANAENLIAGLGVTHDLTFIANGPLNHIGSLSKLYPIIVQGATLVIIDGLKDMGCLFRGLDYPARKMATFMVPAAVRMLLHLGSSTLATYAHKIDFIECGGAPLPHTDMMKLCRLLPQTRLYNTYASTETGIISTYNFNDGRCLPACLGRPMPHSKVTITSDGHIGCQGNTLMSGYIGDPELTTTVMHNGTVYMADLGYIDPEGMLHITGRENDIINVGGYKVAPTEVEDAALTFNGINDCICIAVPHPITGCALKLLTVLANGQTLDKHQLALHLSSRLERYKVPMMYEQVAHIEHTYNGKLNRKYYRSDL